MAEPKNFGVLTSDIGAEFARLRREVDRLIFDVRASQIGPRLFARFMGAGLRPVVVWLPNTRDPEYRARLADQCRRLAADLTADEEAMASAFEKEAAQTPGWR
jgi:Protein  of unknown function (DUF3018)